MKKKINLKKKNLNKDLIELDSTYLDAFNESKFFCNNNKFNLNEKTFTRIYSWKSSLEYF